MNKETLKITITNLTPNQIKTFKRLFVYMQYLGTVGASRQITLYLDGDGDFRPKIEELEGLKPDMPTDNTLFLDMSENWYKTDRGGVVWESEDEE